MKQNYFHIKTPLILSQKLSEISGCEIYLKMEAYQPTGSFKIRGIGYAAQEAKKSGMKHFISSSGGNAGLAVAYAGKLLQTPVTVYLPKSTPEIMKERIEFHGAEVVIAGEVWDDANLAALERSKAPGCFYIPPFDLPAIWHGHSTMIDEIKEEILKPDGIVVSVGGAGLLGGVFEGLQRNNWGHCKVYTTETTGAASFANSLQANKLVTLEKIQTVAHSLGAKTVAKDVFEMAKKFSVESIVLTDKEAVQACLNFVDHHRVLVEPSCGAALAAIYFKKIPVKKHQKIVVIVCGGVAVTLEQLTTWLKTL